MTTLRIGGALAVRCPTCTARPGAPCWTLAGPDGRPTPWPRKQPHAARVKAAPPEQQARVGDLVVVRHAGADRLAVVTLAEDGLVRIWRRELGRFERMSSPIAPANVLRLAPEDERSLAARAALAEEGLAA